MRRIYHHYSVCEEFAAGMWRVAPLSERDSYAGKSANLLKDEQGFVLAMARVVREWPHSCEQNLTAPGVNHQAWFGAAGCCVAHGAPQDLTRLGWHTLTDREQTTANRAADEAFAGWCQATDTAEQLVIC